MTGRRSAANSRRKRSPTSPAAARLAGRARTRNEESVERLVGDLQQLLSSISTLLPAVKTRGVAHPRPNRKSCGLKSNVPHVAVAVVARGGTSERLLKLLVSAVRLTPEQLTASIPTSFPIYQTYQAVRLFLGTSGGPEVPRSPVWLQRQVFVHKLSRMHTLQALSRQLAAAAAAVEEAMALPGGPQGPAAYENASAVAADILYFLKDLGLFGYNALNIADDARSATSVSSALRGCCVELVAALYDSCVMEHAAKLLLLLSTRAAPPADTSPQLQDQQEPEPRPGQQPPPPQQQQQQQSWSNVCDRNVKDAVTLFASMYRALYRCFNPIFGISATASDQLKKVLSGPCVRHAVLTHALAALCEADEGEAYGLPPDVLWRVPVAFADENPTGGGSDIGEVHSTAAGALWVLSHDSAILAAVSALLPAFRAPPLSRRAALRLLQRIGNLAVASGQVWAEAAGAAAAGAAGGSASGGGSGNASLAAALGLRAVLPRGYDASVAFNVLLVMRLNLQPLHPDADYTRWVNEVAAWWRLLAGYARHMAASAPAEEVQQLAESAADVLDEYAVLPCSATEGFVLPAAPPPEVAAALAGGLLPCLERLLRRAGGNFGGPEASLAQGILRSASCLPLLLLYGERRDAAALVATMGKLLRGIDPRVIWDAVDGPPERRTETTTFWLQLIEAACDFLVSAAGTMEAIVSRIDASAKKTAPDGNGVGGMATEADAGGGVESDGDGGYAGRAAATDEWYEPPVKYLRLLTSCALCEWLPPLSRLAQQVPVAVRPQAGGRRRAAASSSSGGGGGGGSSHGNWQGFHAKVLGAATRWLPALVAECVKDWKDLEAAAAAAVAAVEATQGSSSGAGATSASPTAGTPTSPSSAAASSSSVSSSATSTAAPTAASAAPDDGGSGGDGSGGWRHLLLEDVAVIPLVGTALKLLGTAEPDPHFRLICCVMALAFPEKMWQARQYEPRAAAAGSAAAAAGGGGASSSDSAVAGWLPETLFRVLAPCLEADADSMQGVLAAQILAAALVCPAKLRANRLLRRCGNPGCANLRGDSETELGLKACGRCGAVGYCCRECQTAHWRAGHKETCSRKCED